MAKFGAGFIYFLLGEEDKENNILFSLIIRKELNLIAFVDLPSL